MAVEIARDTIQLRVSQAGACPRRLQLEAWGVEGAPVWEGTERAFAEGRIHEPDILDWAAKNLPGGPYGIIQQQCEVTIELGWGKIVGHIDGMATTGDPYGYEYLVEAKCLSHRAFQELREKGVQVSHPQYYTQVQLYLHGLLKAAWPINQAFLVARNKETPKTRLFDHHYEAIIYDPYFVEEELIRLNKLAESIQHHIEIAPPYNPLENWQCRYPWCTYAKVCYPDYAKPKAEAIVDDSIANVVEQYQSLGEEISELEKAREELKARLLATLKDRPVIAGRWMVQKAERRQERFDTQLARKELSPDVLAKLIKVNTYEQLKIEEVR